MLRRRFIPTSPQALSKQEYLDYSQGYNSYTANDLIPANVLVQAVDTRISTLGRQKTRQGCDFYTIPAGESVGAQQLSVTGAGSQTMTTTGFLTDKFVASSTGRLSRVDLNLRNTASGTGPVIVEVRADVSGSPGGTVLAQSSIAAASLGSSYAYLIARFIEAPQVASGITYWIVAYQQDDGTNSYSWSSTTTAATAKTSSGGMSWSSTAFSLNLKTYVATDSPTLGHYRAYRSDGTRQTLMGHGTSLYSVNDGTGALTALNSALNAAATRYVFDIANDIVYYTNGVDAPRKWNFTTEAVVGGSPAVSSSNVVHKNRMFYVSASDPTRIFFSGPADFENFSSTDFLYIPSPKSPDRIVRMVSFNDNLLIFTTKTKWVLSGGDISSMVLRQATGVKGTKAYDSIQVTRNYVYFASDDGLYSFNGSTDELLSQNITADYAAATNEVNWGSALYNNRYYVAYTPSGGSVNSRTWVYNINYQSMESNDTGTYVQKMDVWGGSADAGQLIQASNLMGALYYGELASNTYNNLGKKLAWELRTSYEHFGNPAATKHIKRWYPRFAATSGAYSVLCRYDKDFADAPNDEVVPLQGSGYLLGSALPKLGAIVLGKSALIKPRLSIPGNTRYIQRRYRRSGVNTPVEFEGDTLYYQLRRPR